MSSVRVVTDSTCDLNEDLLKELGITMVPLTIIFDEQEFVDRTELSSQDFYQKMAESETLPTTAAPGPGPFVDVFRQLAANGAEGILCVNISHALSATGQAAMNAAEAVSGEIEVRCVDSCSLTGGLGGIAINAAKAAAEGAPLAEVAELAERQAARTRLFGALNTLENLKRSGRVSGAKAMFGNILAIKPIVDVSTGEVLEAAKPRTRRRAFEWIRDRLVKDSPISDLYLGHGAAKDFNLLLEILGDAVDVSQARLGDVGPVIGTHAGEGVVGVSYTTDAPI